MTHFRESESRYRKTLRLAAMACLLRDGYLLDTRSCMRMFHVSRKTAQRDLNQVHTIMPVIRDARGLKRA